MAKTWTTDAAGVEWIGDESGNRCSVRYWGSKEAAEKVLDSLVGCSRCSDCSYCSGCSRCSGCSGCSRCSEKKNLAPGEVLKPIDIPIIPNIHQAVYAASSRPESLEMGDVHTCADTHCRAGWVVTLAGKAGKKLEEFFNWELAAMLIYDASNPGFKIHPARFYDSNADALADMQRLAEAEAAKAVV